MGRLDKYSLLFITDSEIRCTLEPVLHKLSTFVLSTNNNSVMQFLFICIVILVESSLEILPCTIRSVSKSSLFFSVVPALCIPCQDLFLALYTLSNLLVCEKEYLCGTWMRGFEL